MVSPFFGEFMDTLVLILLGDGVIANILLKRSKAEGAGWMVIATGWCFAVMTGVYTAIARGSRDAYINPAVTMGFATASGDYDKSCHTLGHRCSEPLSEPCWYGCTSCRIGGKRPILSSSSLFSARLRRFGSRWQRWWPQRKPKRACSDKPRSWPRSTDGPFCRSLARGIPHRRVLKPN